MESKILPFRHYLSRYQQTIQAKYKQAKAEGNSAQTSLQKEVTLLRDTNRSLQLRLRDIEVANDDYERQARNTTSSLEDLESKYNVAVERGVLLEEEIRNGDKEREDLRILTQRLRDELADLKIETHITQEKLKKSEAIVEEYNQRRVPLAAAPQTPEVLEHSPTTTASSPTMNTPPTKSTSSAASDAPTPPSPPFSEKSATLLRKPSSSFTPGIPRPKMSTPDLSAIPKPSSRTPRHSRGPSVPSTPGFSAQRKVTRTDLRAGANGIARSGSLYQIRGLIGKAQKLEERVHTVRSRLPAPTTTPPHASSRSGSAASYHNYVPATVTLRSSRKRGSVTSSVASSMDGESIPSVMGHSRRSFGRTQTTPSRSAAASSHGESRPSSRMSASSRSSFGHTSTPGLSGIPQPQQTRPDSRQGRSGSRTPLGHHSSQSHEVRRPRSSLSNYSHSMNHINEDDDDYRDEGPAIATPTPRRRSVNHQSGIPTPHSLRTRPSGAYLNAKMSSSTGIPAPRRISSGLDRQPRPQRKTSVVDLGETY